MKMQDSWLLYLGLIIFLMTFIYGLMRRNRLIMETKKQADVTNRITINYKGALCYISEIEYSGNKIFLMLVDFKTKEPFEENAIAVDVRFNILHIFLKQTATTIGIVQGNFIIDYQGMYTIYNPQTFEKINTEWVK